MCALLRSVLDRRNYRGEEFSVTIQVLVVVHLLILHSHTIQLASPWSNKVALVVGTQISSFKPSYLLGLTWAGTTTTGHTKKLCLMSSCVVAAAVANMISPE